MPVDQTRRTVDGLTVKAHRGDGSTLLAFDVPEHLKDDLAGFAVECHPPKGAAYPLLNRLSFEQAITAGTTPEQRTWTPTDQAPLQTFRWVHFPGDVMPGDFTYRVTAMLFALGSESGLQPGPQAEVSLGLMDEGYANFSLGFTRGYLSSQAYADEFKNEDFEPANPTIDFDTKPFEDKWRWLGFHARFLVFGFIGEALDDPKLTLDVFAYDLDEPDFIRDLAALGPRLRLFLDNSKNHVGPGASEPEAQRVVEAAGGAVTVGKFGRFAHDKVMIQRRDGAAVKVLSGSANFSIRGLYVQSNNVFVFDDPETAKLYEQAFEQAWTDAAGFRDSPTAAQWFERRDSGLPTFDVSFSPHRTAGVSLDRVAEAIKQAKSSVLFAIMEVGAGSGPVLDAVRALPKRTELYAFGTTQRTSGALQVHAPGRPATFIPFSYLKDKVPWPFRPEVSGGAGQVIHHKFVVVDFNDAAPAVFAGSSNLAAGGETENGDNLLAFYDRNVASTYAVEAVRLIDHYRFRAVMKTASDAKPLGLKKRSDHWADSFFDPKNARYLERVFFVK